MNFKNISAVLFLILIILSCNNSDTKEETQKKEGKFENLKDNSLSSIDSPCELISIDEIRTICNVGSEIEITQEEKNRTKSTCEFEWKDKKVNKVIMAGGQDITIDMPSEVMIIMVEKANDKMFKQSTIVYKDGVESAVQNAEQAIWGTKMSQLTFLSKGYMFHVYVKISNNIEENKIKAIEIAERLINKI